MLKVLKKDIFRLHRVCVAQGHGSWWRLTGSFEWKKQYRIRASSKFISEHMPIKSGSELIKKKTKVGSGSATLDYCRDNENENMAESYAWMLNLDASVWHCHSSYLIITVLHLGVCTNQCLHRARFVKEIQKEKSTKKCFMV